MGQCVTYYGQIQMVQDIQITLVPLNNVVSSLQDISGWGLSPRGAGFLFGADITKVRQCSQTFRKTNIRLVLGICTSQCDRPHRSSPPARDGGLQIDV